MVGRGMSLGTGLSGEGEGDLLTAGLSNHNLLVLNLILTLDLCDLNSLGDTDPLGGRVGQLAGNLQGGSDKGDLVSLGLVLLTADLMLSLAISVSLRLSISRSSTGSNLHGL